MWIQSNILKIDTPLDHKGEKEIQDINKITLYSMLKTTQVSSLHL